MGVINPVTFIGAFTISGTSGSLLFVDSNTAIAQDNANLFWDDTNNRLGIGINAPDAQLRLDNSDSVSSPFNYSVRVTNQMDAGTLSSSSRQISVADFNAAPAVTVSPASSATFGGYGINSNINAQGINITGAGTNTIDSGGVKGIASGSPTFNTAGVVNFTSAGLNYSNLTGTTIISLGSASTYKTYGANVTNSATSGGNANLTSTAYGGSFIANGNLTTTGTTVHYGGYFLASGTADNNYGAWIDATISATNNYGLRIDEASTNTLWVAGATDPTTAAGGVVFGTSKDTNLYRSAADTLKTDDSFTVGTNLVVTGTASFNGTVTIGDASSDAVTVNSNAWTFANDTNFTLSGGVNGLSFDGTTFSVDATNDRIGIGTASPSDKLHINGSLIFSDLADTTRNIYLTGNTGAIRIYATNSLTSTPDGAALQFWGVGSSLHGQGYMDAGAHDSGGLFFRTAGTAGTITTRFYIAPTGDSIFYNKLGVGGTTPNALLHMAAGTATANTAPLKFTSGTNLTTAEAGAMEYNGTNLFFTRTGTTRENVLVAVDNATAPATTVGVAIVNFYGSAATNFLGTPNRWMSINILGTVYKVALYT